METATKLKMSCPLCGSPGVFYSCTPNCCFNHVCGGCGATFEPATRKLGRNRPDVQPPDPLPDASDPAAECAACHSTSVYSLGEEIVCGACGAMLALEYTEVQGA